MIESLYDYDYKTYISRRYGLVVLCMDEKSDFRDAFYVQNRGFVVDEFCASYHNRCWNNGRRMGARPEIDPFPVRGACEEYLFTLKKLKPWR